MLTTMLLMAISVGQVRVAEVRATIPEQPFVPEQPNVVVARAFAELNEQDSWIQKGRDGFATYGVDGITIFGVDMEGINTSDVWLMAGTSCDPTGSPYVEGESIVFAASVMSLEPFAMYCKSWFDDQQEWQSTLFNTGPVTFIHELLTIGDSSRDGAFNSSDLVQVFQRGEYEDVIDDNSTWESGDWSLDRDFDSSDLVLAFQQGEYEQPQGAVAIPEPSTLVMLLIAALCAIRNFGSRRP